MTMHKNSSVATIQLGGRSYSAVSVANCLTCQSPYREDIERLALEGRPWSEIVASLPADAGLSSRNLANHWSKGHLPVVEPAVQAFLDQSSAEKSTLVKPAVDNFVDELEFARMMLSSTVARMAAGEITPDIKDGLKAADLLARYAPPSNGASLQDFTDAMLAVHDCAKEFMPPEQFSEFVRMLANDKTMNRLADEWDARQRHAR